MKSILALGLCLLPLACVLGYNNKYEAGDSWSLEECLPAPETGDTLVQGESKREYNEEDEIWFYLEVPMGDNVAEATPLAFSGFFKSGWGWAHEEDPELANHIGGYPLIYKVSRGDNSISVHPSAENDLVIAWKSPVTGDIAIEGFYTRLDENGDGQVVSLYHDDQLLSEEIAGSAAQDLVVAKERVSVKKGERISLRIGKLETANNDGALLRFKITLL